VGMKYMNLSSRYRIIMMKNETMKDTIWFFEIVLAKIPIAA